MNRIPCPLQKAAREFAQSPAVILAGQQLSYQDLHQAVNGTQDYLQKCGVKPRDHVAVLAPNSVEYVRVLWALWRLGAVACPLSPRHPAATLTGQIGQLGCSVLIASADVEFKQPLKNCQRILIADCCAAKNEGETADEIALDQPATIVFTSGSSGVPKAVVHTFGNHYYSALGANEHMPADPTDRWLLSLPLYHVSGLGILFRMMLCGGCVTIPETGEDLIVAISNGNPTHVSLVTTQLLRLIQDGQQKTLRSLKTILLGGSPIPDDLLRQAKDAQLPLYITYGLTETASQVATSGCLLNSSLSRPRAKILNYRKVRIAPDHEILVSGEVLFRGYWGEGSKRLTLTPQDWFPTGDLGFVDQEGYLVVTGRKDAMFISGGENVHPEEVERQLLRISDIEQAVVVPVADTEFGFRPAAFLKPRANKKITRSPLVTYLKDKLPGYKIPKYFFRWPPHLSAAAVKVPRRMFINLVREGKGLEEIEEI